MTPTHRRYVLRHGRGSLFSSFLAAERLSFPMETLAVVHAATEREAQERADLVRQSFAAAGKGYLPGPEPRLARVA
jgi:hypothetical protein